MADRGPQQPGFFEGLVLGLHEGLILLDPDGTFLWASPHACELLGRELDDLVGIRTNDIEPPEDVAMSQARRAERAQQHPGVRAPWQRVLRNIVLPDGGTRLLDCTLTELGEDPRVGGDVVLIREASELHNSWETERRLHALVQNSQEAVVVYDRGLNLLYANQHAGDILEDLSGDLLQHVHKLVAPGQVADALADFERVYASPGSSSERLLQLFRSDGSTSWVQLRLINLLDDPAVTGLVFNGRDVTEQVELERSLREAATRDPLTGLPNRTAITELLAGELAFAQADERLAVLFLDLDRFKVVNDSYGHVVGDRVLADLAARLRDVVGERGTVGRFGGDEYVVVAGVTNQSEAVGLAGVLAEAASRPFVVATPDQERAEVYLSGSVGIALSHSASDPATLIHHADAAMYRAKERGRGTWELYDEEMRSAAISRLTIEAELARALDEDAFELWYQPIVDAHTRRTVALEALARWRTSSGEIIPPGEFIPIVEETGGIHRLGSWALRTACAQLATWQAQGLELPVSVNLSPRQLSRPELAAEIRDLLSSTGVSADRLSLEITETLLMDDFDLAVKALQSLREIGVRLALDDFGTGWSSLTYLRQVPVDVVKVDRSFVSGVVESTDDKAIVGAVVSMCRALGKRVVAEGVETEAQLLSLRTLGADHAQGYFFAKPLPAAELETWLAAYTAAGNRNP